MNRRCDIAAEIGGALAKIDDHSIAEMADLLAHAPAIFASGAGRSGCMLRAAVMRFMHMGIPTHVIGEIATPAGAAGDVLLVGSGSGETGTLKAVAAKAKQLGMKIAVITISADSTLGRLADVCVEIPAPTPKRTDGGQGASVQPMGSLFEQAMLLLLDSIVMDVMAKKEIAAAQMFVRHANLE